jgi:hypothetical protein
MDRRKEIVNDLPSLPGRGLFETDEELQEHVEHYDAGLQLRADQREP